MPVASLWSLLLTRRCVLLLLMVQERCRGLVEVMQKLRAEAASLMESLREKEDRARRLNAEFDRIPKEVNRSVYTRRILDIVKQVRKQKVEIAKVGVGLRRCVGTSMVLQRAQRHCRSSPTSGRCSGKSTSRTTSCSEPLLLRTKPFTRCDAARSLVSFRP